MKNAKKSLKSDLKSSPRGIKRTAASISIFTVPIFGTRKLEVLRKIYLQRKELLHVVTVNSEYIMETLTNPPFGSMLSQSLTVADGYGIVWASKILHNRQVERISGIELVQSILQHASEAGEKVFLLGAKPGVAERAALAMSKKYPGTRLATYSGAESVSLEKREEASMTIAKINAYEPHYLLVAYGSPWQDMWIEENRPYLRARVAIGIGGVLDEWAGVVTPCPSWIDQIGLKWLWRFVHEPSRWRRILKVWQFGLLVLWERLKRSF